MSKEEVQNFFPAVRVFVFGVEVTNDVIDVSVTLSDSRSPGTASVSLANKDTERGFEDRYIVTEKDILAMVLEAPLDVRLPAAQAAHARAHRITEARDAEQEVRREQGSGTLFSTAAILALYEDIISEEARAAGDEAFRAELQETSDHIKQQILANLDRRVGDPLKARVLRAKAGVTVEVGAPLPSAGGVEYAATVADIAALRGEAHRYPYQVGDSIFHSNDPVRIFLRDLYNPTVWYHAFTGFVSDTVDDIDENNAKTVTLRCEDPLRRLREARITTSPGIVDLAAVSAHVDLVVRTFFNDDFSDFTLTEFLFTMIFGFRAGGTFELAKQRGNLLSGDELSGLTTKTLIGPDGTTIDVEMPKDGVGLFNRDRSMICIFGPEDPDVTLSSDIGTGLKDLEVNIQSLAVYQAVVDTQVRITDLSTMHVKGAAPIPESVALRGDTVDVEAVIEAIGTNPHIYPVDGGRLIVLAPTTMGVGYHGGLLLRGFKGAELKSTFGTRLQKIFDVLQRAEFSFYANGRGDLLAEMPLYDFDPVDFGTEPVTYNDISGQIGELRAATMFSSGHVAGPFAPHFRIPRGAIGRHQRTFTDEKIRTFVTSEWYNLRALPEGETSLNAGQRPARRLLEALIPQFGVRHEAAEPTVLLSDHRGAEIYCQLELNRYNGEARQVTFDAIPQLRIAPNRPLEVTERSYIGSVREVTHSLQWASDMTMSLKLNYIRGWDGSRDPETNRPYYSHYGGFRANPQNYALLLKDQLPREATAKQKPPETQPLPGEE